jgi:hypothetical protein
MVECADCGKDSKIEEIENLLFKLYKQEFTRHACMQNAFRLT